MIQKRILSLYSNSFYNTSKANTVSDRDRKVSVSSTKSEPAGKTRRSSAGSHKSGKTRGASVSSFRRDSGTGSGSSFKGDSAEKARSNSSKGDLEPFSPTAASLHGFGGPTPLVVDPPVPFMSEITEITIPQVYQYAIGDVWSPNSSGTSPNSTTVQSALHPNPVGNGLTSTLVQSAGTPFLPNPSGTGATSSRTVGTQAHSNPVSMVQSVGASLHPNPSGSAAQSLTTPSHPHPGGGSTAPSHVASLADLSRMSRWEIEQLYYYNAAILEEQKHLMRVIEHHLAMAEQERKQENIFHRPTTFEVYRKFLDFLTEPDTVVTGDTKLFESSSEDFKDLIVGGTALHPIINSKYDIYKHL